MLCSYYISVVNLLILIPYPHYIDKESEAHEVIQLTQGFPANKGWSFKSTAYKSNSRDFIINHKVKIPFIASH